GPPSDDDLARSAPQSRRGERLQAPSGPLPGDAAAAPLAAQPPAARAGLAVGGPSPAAAVESRADRRRGPPLRAAADQPRDHLPLPGRRRPRRRGAGPAPAG